jgi:hypothetical protein
VECLEKAPPLQKPQGWATQLQRQKPTSKAKANLKGKKAQLQRQKASGGVASAKWAINWLAVAWRT